MTTFALENLVRIEIESELGNHRCTSNIRHSLELGWQPPLKKNLQGSGQVISVRAVTRKFPYTVMTCRAPCARANVLGVGISAIDIPLAALFVVQAIASKRPGYICVTGAHGVIEAQRDADFRKILNTAYMCTPDGMPTVWMGRLMGYRQIQRVYGPDLMLEICRISAAHGIRHFLYGGANGTADRLRTQLCRRFPGLEIVGTFEPPFRALNEQEMAKLRDQLAATEPDVMWVGLSTPKQENLWPSFLQSSM